jgi:hypothetical protein
MPVSYPVNGNLFTIPDYDDSVDMVGAFESYTDSMPAPTSVAGSSTVVVPADINKIFEFNNTSGTRVDHTLTLTGTDFWRVQDGKGYGFQFGIVTANDYVSIVADGTSLVLPFSSVKENSFALVTRVSATLWVVAGAGADIDAFILNSSLLSGGDFYG